MAAIAHSHTRLCAPLRKQFSTSGSRRRLTRRCYCSQVQQTNSRRGDDVNDDELDNSVKPKAPTNTKRARTIARLINSKPWSNDLQSSLSSLSPSLSKTTVLQTLRLIKIPSKAFHFFNWVQETGFSHTDQSYFMMIEILGRNRNLNVARNLLFSIEKRSNGVVKLDDRVFNSLIRNYGRAGLFQESVKMFTTMKSLGVSPSVVTFNSLLLVLLKRGRTNMARELYDEMLRTYGVTPDTYTFNILIRGFCKNSMVDEGFRFFKMMSRFKCEPDIVTYNTLVDGLCQAGKAITAHNVVKGMYKKSMDLNPNVVTYTALIRGYCMKQESDEALAVLGEMASRGVKPNIITYNTLIKGICEVRKMDKIKTVLEGMMEVGGFTPDTCTFNTIITAHCSAGNLDEALNVFGKMIELQAQPDSATYSVLIRSLCHIGDYARAEKLFDELSEKEIVRSNVGCKPLVAAYNPMFEHLCRNGKTNKAEKVFRQLMRRGTQDPPSYNTLIVGHCREGTYEAGYDLLVWMLRRDFVPDVEIYESLIGGFLQRGNPLLAQQTLEKMLKSSHLPKTSTFHSIFAQLLEKGCANESSSLIMLMLERKVRQNMNLSTNCVRLLFGRGLRDKAFRIVGLIYKNGCSVKVEELVGFLCQSRKLLEAREMLLFSLDKHQNIDANLCDTVVVGLCKMNKLSEAFGLYYELVERGVHQHLTCIYDLKTALDAGGRSDEAAFVSKRIPGQRHLDRPAPKSRSKQLLGA